MVNGYELDWIDQGEVAVMLPLLKVRLHIATKTVYTLTTKVILQTFNIRADSYINLLFDEKQTFSSNIYRKNDQKLSPLTKGSLDSCFCFPQEQLISVPTRFTSKTITLLDCVLSQCGVIELDTSDHDFIYCTKERFSLKLNKHNEISIRSMKNYTIRKIFRNT